MTWTSERLHQFAVQHWHAERCKRRGRTRFCWSFFRPLCHAMLHVQTWIGQVHAKTIMGAVEKQVLPLKGESWIEVGSRKVAGGRLSLDTRSNEAWIRRKGSARNQAVWLHHTKAGEHQRKFQMNGKRGSENYCLNPRIRYSFSCCSVTQKSKANPLPKG